MKTSLSANSYSTGNPLRLSWAVGAVFLLWLAYSVLQTMFVMGLLSEPLFAVLAFLPGQLAVAALLAAGLSRQDCYLRATGLSRTGFWVLAAVLIFALVAILPSGQWQGWLWTAALVYAPASGISQELFFRAALLPACQIVFKGRPMVPLMIHAVLFALWHIGPLFLGAPLWAVLAIMAVSFVCGIGWGWQVRHDETVVWAMVQHSLIWVIGLQFAFPA